MIEKIDSSRPKVRNFGFLFGALCLALSAYYYFKGGPAWPWLLALAAAFVLAGLFASPVLRPLYVAWMLFAFVLGWINTRILLGVFFYVVMTPVGVVLRLTGKDLLDRRLDRSAKSYWIRRGGEPFDRSRYERLF